MAFHSYPRLIRKLFNAFSLDKGRSPGFASAVADFAPFSGSLSLRLRASWRLASPATATRRLIMQKARRHRTSAAPTACRRMVSGSFSLLCPRFFSPFPHGTRPLSVLRYSGGGPAWFRVSPTGLSPSPAGVSTPLGYASPGFLRPLLLPRRARRHAPGLGILRFRSPLLAESLLFSSPAGTEMFQFPALAPL